MSKGKKKEKPAFIRKAKPYLQKYGPIALLIYGLVSSIAAFILNIRATHKAQPIIAEAKDEAEALGTKINYKGTFVKLAKTYALPVGLFLSSMGSFLFSYRIQSKRIAVLCSAINTLMTAGSATDKQAVKVSDQIKLDAENLMKYTEFARFFDDSSSEWQSDADTNLVFLRGQENYLNDLLRVEGHVFLNDVYNRLGLPDSSIGALVGWVYDKNDPNANESYIDFGLYDIKDSSKRRFVNGNENAVLLDFNVQGVIYDLI